MNLQLTTDIINRSIGDRDPFEFLSTPLTFMDIEKQILLYINRFYTCDELPECLDIERQLAYKSLATETYLIAEQLRNGLEFSTSVIIMGIGSMLNICSSLYIQAISNRNLDEALRLIISVFDFLVFAEHRYQEELDSNEYDSFH